jgi:hypothetical protein
VTEPENAGLNAAGRHAATPTIGQLVAEASAHVSTIVRGEIDLAKHELKSSVKNAGTGAGLFIGAAALLLFSLTFLFIGVAEVLARYVMPRYAAFFATFGFFMIIAGLLVWIGIRKVKRVKAPTRTIETGKDTVAYLKANTNIR